MRNLYENLSSLGITNEVITAVSETLSTVAYHFVDVTKVEERVLRRLARLAESGVTKTVTESTAKRLANKEASYLIKNNRYTDVEQTRFGELDVEGDEGSSMTFEPIDLTAMNEGQDLALNELISSIVPEGDVRRKLIVDEWLSGETNDRNIARLLEETLGGKLKTHVTFISRFKLECRELLGGF